MPVEMSMIRSLQRSSPRASHLPQAGRFAAGAGLQIHLRNLRNLRMTYIQPIPTNPLISDGTQFVFEQLPAMQFGIEPTVLHQIVVRASFRDAPLVERDDEVGVADG
jgi:hypothetical protein